MKNLNIHGAFQMHKRFFKVEKGCLDFKNILHSKKKKRLLQRLIYEMQCNILNYNISNLLIIRGLKNTLMTWFGLTFDTLMILTTKTKQLK